MNYDEKQNAVSDLQIAYIGGGSRGWAWTFMTDLAMEKNMSGTIRLYDIDMEAAGHNERIGNDLSTREDASGKWNYETYSSLESALTGADFVVISILPGTFDEMAVDVHTPERLGIWQSVGDTAGPGGIMRSLRTLPMFVEIGEAIKKYSPDAWVINYTNPMTLCVKVLYCVFPEIKAFGCCHEVFGTQRVLKGITEQMLGLKDIERSDIHVNVLGINHFTWFDYASYRGIDLFPVYRDYIDSHFEEGFQEKDRSWMNSAFHWRKNDLKERLEKSRKLFEREEQVELKPTGEEGILLIKALCGLGRMVSNVNIPNTDGQISNLPVDEVVETNAIFDRNSIRPIMAGSLPQPVLDLIMPHVRVHDKTMRAALSPDLELVVEAFLEDPNVKAKKPSEKDVRSLVIDMLKGTKAYLPKEWEHWI